MNIFKKLFGSKNSAPASPAPAVTTPPPASTPSAPVAGFAPAPLIPPAPPAPPSSVVPTPEASFRFQAVPASHATPAPASTPAPVRIETTLLALPSPLWLPFDSPASELMPLKSDDAPVVAFLGGSADLGAPDSPDRGRFAEAASRLARTLPLVLAEEIEFTTDALTRPLLAWMVKPTPGFILGGKNWDDATASRHARQTVPDDPADYLVVTHLVCHEDPWNIELRLVRTIDATCLTTATVSCPAANPAAALSALTRDLIDALVSHVSLPTLPALAAAPLHPSSAPVSARLLALDQLLAVLTTGLGPAAGRLSGEREIIESQLRLCQAQATDVPVRLLFAHTLRALGKTRPDSLPEFRDRVTELQRENPLPEPAHAVTDRVLAEAFAD